MTTPAGRSARRGLVSGPAFFGGQRRSVRAACSPLVSVADIVALLLGQQNRRADPGIRGRMVLASASGAREAARG